MGKRKSERKLEGDESEPSESADDSQMERRMEEFDSDRSWSELDEMERQLAEGIHEVQSPEDMPKKPKKRDRIKEREQEIAEYESALKIAEAENVKFMNPFEPYDLNVDVDEYEKLVAGAVEGTTPPQGVARILGFKSLRILHNERLYAEFGMVKEFLQNLSVAEWIQQSHRFLLNSEGNTLFKPSETTVEPERPENRI